MKKFFLFTFAFFFCLNSLQTEMHSVTRLFDKDSNEYTQLETYYALSGIAAPSTTFPITAKEMLLLAKRVKIEKLPEAAAAKYELLLTSLEESQKKEMSLGLGASVAVEGYIQANPKDFGGVAFDDTLGTIQKKYPNTTVKSEYGHRLTHDENLLYGFTDRKPFLNVPLTFSFSPWVFAKFNLRLKNVRSFYAYQYPSINGILMGNIITTDNYFDMTFPDEAYIAVDGHFFNIIGGRNKKGGWGNGKDGNLFFGSHLDYYDNLRIRFFSDIFTYTFQLTTFDAFFGYAPSSLPYGDSGYTGNENTDPIPFRMRYFVGHRFDIRLFDRFNFAINEGVMVYSPTFLLQTISPIYFLHNSYSYGTSNVSLSLELDGYIGKGFGFYLQWCSDQMTAPQEIKLMQDKVEPQAFAYMGGLTYNNFFKWGAYSAFLEFVLTDPYMYLEKGQPDQYAYYRTFDNAMYNYNNAKNGIRKIAKPIGYVYGPDAIVLSFGQQFRLDKLKIQPKLTYFLAGENNRALNYKIGLAAHKQRTPTGAVLEHNFIAQTQVNYEVNKFFEVYGHAGMVYSVNHMNQPGRNDFDFQLSLGAEIKIFATWPFNFPS